MTENYSDGKAFPDPMAKETNMYNPKSMKAEEFICHEEVEATLKYADEHKDDTELIEKILEKA